MSEAPTITALAPWFGAKRNLAPHVVAALGPHRSYWEPFCGSMAVLLAKPPATMETVNDLHGDLINLARCVRHKHWGPWLYRQLRRVVQSDVTQKEAQAALAGEAAPPWATSFKDAECGPFDGVRPWRAYWYFIAAWLGRNGVAGTGSYNNGYCVRYTHNGGHAAKRFALAVLSIPQWRDRLRQVTILERCAFALLARIEDADGAAIYLDPPYIVKGAKYVHDFNQPCAECHREHTHAELAELANRFARALVIVSYYAHHDLLTLYPRWHRQNIEVSKALASSGKRTKNDIRAVEVLLGNRPFAGAVAGLFAEASA